MQTTNQTTLRGVRTTVTLIMKFIINHFSLDTDWILIFTMYIAYKVFCKIILNSKYTASDFGKNPESNRKFFVHELASKFIRFGLVYILNLSPFLKEWKTTFPVSLRLYSKC